MRLIFLVTALVLWCDLAQSQEPPPTPTVNSQQQKGHPENTNQKTAPDPAGSNKNPFVIKSIEAEKTPEHTEQEHPERNEKAANEGNLILWTMVLAVATIILAVVAGIQVGMFWKQLGIMRIAIRDGETVANATALQANAVIRAQRAYVKASPAPPGLELPPPYDAINEHATCNLKIKNFGQTPAIVSDVVTIFKLLEVNESLPTIPEYVREDEIIRPFPGSFLGRDEFFYNGHGSAGAIGTFVDDLKTGKVVMAVFGYVDYMDVFGKRYRAGFGRVFLPAINNRAIYDNDQKFSERCNLIFMSQAGYNYDRERQEAEGNDWDQNSNS